MNSAYNCDEQSKKNVQYLNEPDFVYNFVIIRQNEIKN